ncbi:helix-turn-helix domain-containing protein [Planomicrobium sp. YIM 101495]|uniref:helix-turn-helix domain-containing protein n=1 Tax=Planomicrobium sp. YIM 101495 TaxID=2665160 RepID=UPI0012B7B3BF|nr:helix-turn-helix transcriptional regulator [Planomicrobium sp. YIM 101495]MTD31835.1 helix-turn-helix domain-containing protein [Planomicrobium sp. YIM 101495]
MNEFGEYLRKLRGKKSLRTVSDEAGISHTYLSTLEKGYDPRTQKGRKPNPDVLKKIAKALGTDYNDLMFAAGYIAGGDEKKIAHVIENTKDQDLKDFIQGATLRKYSYDGKPIDRNSTLFITQVMEIILEDALYIAEDTDSIELFIDKKKQVEIKKALENLLKK